MTALVWGLFKPFITIDKIVGDSYVLSWAAGWHGSDEIMYSSRGFTSRRKMMRKLYDLMEEADAVITFNGERFDLKIVNQEFMELGWPPPAPYKSIDLLKTMKSRFRGTSNKLAYWLKKLDLGAKVEHRGFQLWIDCMHGDKKAFAEMEVYNIGDVEELEKLYDYVLPWIPNHPNRSVLAGDVVCDKCGSSDYQYRGYHTTQAGVYRRCQCNKCGNWFRTTTNENRGNPRAVSIR